MMKTTKKIELIVGLISVLLWIPGLFFVTGIIKPVVTSFNVSDDGCVAIGVYNGIILCEENGMIKRLKTSIFEPSSIKISDDSVLVSNDAFWIRYNRNTWKILDSGDVEQHMDETDIYQTVNIGGSEYSYSNRLGRYCIVEKKPSGSVVIRYKEPLFDYIMMLLLNISVIPFLLSHTTLIIHMSKNYDYKDFIKYGRLIPYREKATYNKH